MDLVSYAGFNFANAGIQAIIGRGLPGQNRTPEFRPRIGGSAALAGSTGTGRAIPCEFFFDPPIADPTMEFTLRQMLGAIDVDSSEARTLVCRVRVDSNGDGNHDADQLVEVDAIIGSWTWHDSGRRGVDIVFYATDERMLFPSGSTANGVLTPVTIPNPSFETDTTGWTKSADPANITSAFSRDAGVYFDAAGSGKLVVSVNTAAGLEHVYVTNDEEFACEEGTHIQLRCAVRTTNGMELDGEGVDAWPWIGFYDSGNNLISGAGTTNWFSGQVDDVWESWPMRSHTAPANTAYCKIGAEVVIGPGDTATVYFDAFEFVSFPPGTTTPFTIAGLAPTYVTLTATPAGNFPQRILARQFSITNDGDRTMSNYPVMIDLGDNSASDVSGDYWALLRDGKPQPCQISDYDAVKALMWMTVDHLAPGQTANYTLLVSDQTVLPNVDFNLRSFSKPAFDISFEYLTTTSGSSSTQTNIPTGLGSEDDRWNQARMYILSGAQAGTSILLTGNNATSVTHAALGGGALASGVSILIAVSDNEYWVYPVRQTERSDSHAGLWYASPRQKAPSVIRHDVPGSWAPYLYIDNTDRISQPTVSRIVPPGGSTKDTFAIMDVIRSFNGGENFKRGGRWDGVAYHSPFPIEKIRLDYSMRNQNGMSKFMVGSQQTGGSAAFTEEFADATASTSYVDYSVQDITLEDETYRVFTGMVPNEGDELGTLWEGDEGTATGGTSSTLVDANKDGLWQADMYNGGYVEIRSGTGAGQRRQITDTAANGTLTVSPNWGTNPGTDSRYVVAGRDYRPGVRNYENCQLTIDTSDLTISAIGAEEDAFVLFRDILVDPGASESYRVEINPDVTGRYIVLLDGESLVIDGQQMRAWVEENDAEVRAVSPLAYAVLTEDAAGTQRAAEKWLWLPPGDHTVQLATDEYGVACEIDVAWIEAVYG